MNEGDLNPPYYCTILAFTEDETDRSHKKRASHLRLLPLTFRSDEMSGPSLMHDRCRHLHGRLDRRKDSAVVDISHTKDQHTQHTLHTLSF